MESKKVVQQSVRLAAMAPQPLQVGRAMALAHAVMSVTALAGAVAAGGIGAALLSVSTPRHDSNIRIEYM